MIERCKQCGLKMNEDGTILSPGLSSNNGKSCCAPDGKHYFVPAVISPANPSPNVKVILCVGSNESPIELVPVDPCRINVEEQIAEYFNTNCHRFTNARKIDFSAYRLVNANNEHVLYLSAVDYTTVYRFSLPTVITVESACYWTETKLKALGIDIKEEADINSLLSEFPELDWALINQEIEAFLSRFSKVNDSFCHKFVSGEMPEEVLEAQGSLVKSIMVVKKYPDIESAVDLMITFLLYLCGFYQKRLFAFPQFPFKIRFGDKTADAKPDFTIFDLNSFYRIAVVEDKSEYNPTAEVNVEAQLIAEAIAMAQANAVMDSASPTKKQKVLQDNIVLGIRVRGTLLSFYVIPITDPILEALRTRTSLMGCSSEVRKTKYLDLIRVQERAEILKILCSYRRIAESKVV